MLRLVALIAALVTMVVAGPAADLITELPGWDGPTPTAQYSGYINVTNSKFLHYWYVESQKDPSTDPLIIWFNGGPGCSSLDGFFYEQGPFRFVNPAANGSDGIPPQLMLNTEGSWNLFANMLFLEAPAGVGASYFTKPSDANTNDNITADENLIAIMSFFEMFPELEGRKVFITGESYAGVYVPTLAYAILQSNKAGKSNINLQGIAVGNGCTGYANGACSPAGTQIRGDFLYGHGLFSTAVYEQIQLNSCFDPLVNTSLCTELLQLMAKQVGPANIYDIYDVCINGGLENERHKRHRVHKSIWDPQGIFNVVGGPLECIDGIAASAYMNNPEVQAAIHTNPNVDWTICTGALTYTTVWADLPAQIYPTLIENMRVLIYNGDVDACVPYNGNEQWTTEVAAAMGFEVNQAWQAWRVGGQLAGYVTTYDNANGFQFVTVLGAGHPVPEYKPTQARYMIHRFINNLPIM